MRQTNCADCNECVGVWASLISFKVELWTYSKRRVITNEKETRAARLAAPLARAPEAS